MINTTIPADSVIQGNNIKYRFGIAKNMGADGQKKLTKWIGLW